MGIVSDRLVTVFGGSGFLGRYVVRALCKSGFRVRVAVRRPDLAAHVLTAGVVGQVYAVQANLRYPDSVLRAAEGAEALVNLVGLLAPKGRNTFESVHVFGAGAVAKAAQQLGAKRLIQISALGADEASVSVYAKTKARGEAAALAHMPQAVILRPSVMFGPEDEFFNRLARMACLSPILPIFGGEEALLQPVFVDDVADAITVGVAGQLRPGTVYELGGPEVMTLRQVAELVLKTIRRKRYCLSVPFGLATLASQVLQFVPGSPLTPDQVSLLKSGSVVSPLAIAENRTFEGMCMEPKAAQALVEAYLWRFRRAGQFERAAA